MLTTPPVRVTAPSQDAAQYLERLCDGFSCHIEQLDGSWHVTIDRVGNTDATVAAVLDVVQRWLRESGVDRASVQVGDRPYFMTRDES